MMKKIGVAEFRNHMKDYLDEAADSPGTVMRIGTDRDVFLLSGDTLKQLQIRHVANIWARTSWQALRLNDYRTLSEGAGTKGLPLEIILGLSEFFGLIDKLLELLARPGAKNNVKKWDVTPYVKAAATGKPLAEHGRFDGVYVAATRLFEKAAFGSANTWTLYGWFEDLRTRAMTGTLPFRQEKLENGQEAELCGLLETVLTWVLTVMDLQALQGERPAMDLMYLQFDRIQEWYRERIGSNDGI